jgi:hypothetical protein
LSLDWEVSLKNINQAEIERKIPMKTKTAKVVALQNNEKQNERFRREWEAEQKEREHYAITDHELDGVLGQLIEAIDQHFIESAWNFKTNLEGTGGHWSKRPYMDGFVDKLDPYAAYLLKKLPAALMGNYPNNKPGNPDSDLYAMLYDREECAYVVGVFMGAKLAGASNETFNLLRKHLVL